VDDNFNLDDLEPSLREAFLSGAVDGALQLGLDDADSVGGINEAASQYASTRAALSIKDISDTTEETIQRILAEAFQDPESTIESITEDIDASGIFSPGRAAMIARTEVARAQMQGTMNTWAQLGVEQVNVLLSEDNPCDICEEIADDGPYDLTDPVILSFPFHPNCQCTLVVVTS